MKKMDFNDVIQLAAMVGIIASLIFVGLQMRQSQRIALAAQAQQRAAMLMDSSNAWLESGLDFQSIHFEQNYDAVISESMTAMRTSAHQSWFLYENDYEQYSLGLMPDDIWQAKLRGIDRVYNICEVRPVYQSRVSMFSDNFRAIVESLPNKCPSK
jgi:hypothetical protein